MFVFNDEQPHDAPSGNCDNWNYPAPRPIFFGRGRVPLRIAIPAPGGAARDGLRKEETISMRPTSETHLHARRALLAALVCAPAWAFADNAAQIAVWKTPACGCCKDWVQHLRDNGFQVTVHDVEDTSAIRQRNGVPADYGSCHSARIESYALEGHVPATEIRRLLQERPAAIGLAVPGMPLGAPGMDGPQYGGRRLPYNVYLIERAGGASVYQKYL